MRKNEISSQKTLCQIMKWVSDAMAVGVRTLSVWKHTSTQQEVEYGNWLKI